MKVTGCLRQHKKFIREAVEVPTNSEKAEKTGNYTEMLSESCIYKIINF